LYNVKNICTT